MRRLKMPAFINPALAMLILTAVDMLYRWFKPRQKEDDKK